MTATIENDGDEKVETFTVGSIAIVVKQRLTDNGRWKAHVESDPKMWDTGRTKSESIGELVISLAAANLKDLIGCTSRYLKHRDDLIHRQTVLNELQDSLRDSAASIKPPSDLVPLKDDQVRAGLVIWIQRRNAFGGKKLPPMIWRVVKEMTDSGNVVTDGEKHRSDTDKASIQTDLLCSIIDAHNPGVLSEIKGSIIEAERKHGRQECWQLAKCFVESTEDDVPWFDGSEEA